MKPNLRKTERVTFRLTREQRRRLQEAASRSQKVEGDFVRDLVLREVGPEAQQQRST